MYFYSVPFGAILILINPNQISWNRRRAMDKVYLDYNATTPVHPEVVEAMLPYLKDNFGNPSSGHWYGQQTKKAVEKAREQVAQLLGCDTSEVIFTSGGSEANNQALKSLAYANKERGNHIITSQVEHPAILNTCRYLERQGIRVTYLPVDRFGRVSPESVADAITGDTILVTVMHANNEVGTVQPISLISEITRQQGIYLHTDAAQSVGKISAKVDELGVDLLTVAAHKFYGPKGIGALYVRQGTVIEPFIHGAGHEKGRRAGTENVAYIVALGKACELAARNLEETAQKLTELRDYFYQKLKDALGDNIVLNGHPTERLPNTLNVSFTGIDSNEFLSRLGEIAASTGSACSDKSRELSRVLQAMGVKPETGFGAVRFSLGRETTRRELDYAAERIVQEIARLA